MRGLSFTRATRARRAVRDFREIRPRETAQAQISTKRFKSLLRLSALIYCQLGFPGVTQYFPRGPRTHFHARERREVSVVGSVTAIRFPGAELRLVFPLICRVATQIALIESGTRSAQTTRENLKGGGAHREVQRRRSTMLNRVCVCG